MGKLGIIISENNDNCGQLIKMNQSLGKGASK